MERKNIVVVTLLTLGVATFADMQAAADPRIEIRAKTIGGVTNYSLAAVPATVYGPVAPPYRFGQTAFGLTVDLTAKQQFAAYEGIEAFVAATQETHLDALIERLRECGQQGHAQLMFILCMLLQKKYALTEDEAFLAEAKQWWARGDILFRQDANCFTNRSIDGGVQGVKSRYSTPFNQGTPDRDSAIIQMAEFYEAAATWVISLPALPSPEWASFHGLGVFRDALMAESPEGCPNETRASSLKPDIAAARTEARESYLAQARRYATEAQARRTK